MSTERPPASAELRDHWWWRPGWELGRSFYTWHVTFADRPEMRALADAYAPLLAQLPMLDVMSVPDHAGTRPYRRG